jgi:protein TonB
VDYLEEESPRVWPTRLLVAVVVLAVVALLGFGLKELLGDSGPAKKRTVHNISLLKPPPPPPPPKPQEKPPEPEMKKEEVKLDQPKPDAPNQDNAPEGKALGVDAEGGAGSDGFGLVGNKGGRDLLAGGKGAFAFYTNQLQRHLQDELAKNRKLKRLDYRVMVRVWLSKSGSVQRVDLGGSSGDAEVDETLRMALAAAPALRDAPPDNMPQPIRIRIMNRGAG